MTKSELIKRLEKFTKEYPVVLHCAYNSYDIKKISIVDGRIQIEVGEPDNVNLVE